MILDLSADLNSSFLLYNNFAHSNYNLFSSSQYSNEPLLLDKEIAQCDINPHKMNWIIKLAAASPASLFYEDFVVGVFCQKCNGIGSNRTTYVINISVGT